MNSNDYEVYVCLANSLLLKDCALAHKFLF